MYALLRVIRLDIRIDRKIEAYALMEWDPEIDTLKIQLNPEYKKKGGYNNIVKSLIHEMLHAVYPRKSEDWVLDMENAMYDALSDRQLSNLLKRVFGFRRAKLEGYVSARICTDSYLREGAC